MSFCTDQILTLASGLYTELNEPSDISVAYISGVLTSSGQLGALNTRLSQSFWLSGDGPCIAGGFGGEEAHIYGLMYEHDWYKREIKRTLQGGGLILWNTIGDGDGRISRESPVKVAAEYRAQQKDLQEELIAATAQYVRNHSLTVSVDAASLASYPSP